MSTKSGSTRSERASTGRTVRQIDSTAAQPLVFDRVTVARLLSAIGGVGLLVAVVSLALSGDVNAWVMGGVLTAAAGIGAWTVLAPDDLRALVTGRQTAFGTNSLFLSIVMLGIAIIVYTMAAGSGVSVDLTATRLYTLKDNLQPVLNNLQRPLLITAFYTSALLEQQSGDLPVLRMFEDAAPGKIKVNFVDPNEQPILARDFGLTSDFGIYVSFLGPTGVPDPNATEKMAGDYANERWIAEAILRLQARGQFAVAFTVGSNEITTALPATDDATDLRNLLATYGIGTLDLDLTRQDIPPGLTALLILAPQRDYPKVVVDKIAQYMANGGKLLLFVEPAFNSLFEFMNAEASPFATYLWETWGVRPMRSIVFDPLSNYENNFYVRPAQYADDPMLNKDASGSKVQPVFYIAQPLQVEVRTGIELNVLYASSPESFAKPAREAAANPLNVQKAPADPVGPLPLMIKAENSASGARLVVVGDADWIRNSAIREFDGDILWTGVFDYLTTFVSRVTVNPVATQLPLNVDSRDLDIVAVVTLIVMPGLVLLGAVIVWVDRRRRG